MEKKNKLGIYSFLIFLVGFGIYKIGINHYLLSTGELSDAVIDTIATAFVAFGLVMLYEKFVANRPE
ncbi:hypothetical protein HOF92_09500 [bacterium]|jgi:hypothetical protein|nr:hypothetical protein [bacterium]